MKISKALSIASVVVLTGTLTACTSSVPSDEATEVEQTTEVTQETTTEATETESSEQSEQTEEESQKVAYAGEYSLPADTIFAEGGRTGVWFANKDHTIQCVIITNNGQYDPIATCRVYPSFQVDKGEAAKANCQAGEFKGTQATLKESGAQMGHCQSDVPLQMICMSDQNGHNDPMCARDWFATPVLPDNTLLKAGDFECTLSGDKAMCTHKSGKSMTVAPGSAEGN